MKILFISLFLVLICSCGLRDIRLFNPSTYFPDEKDSSAISALKNDTPENVLENLKTSYNRRDDRLYQELISPDYRFYMSPSFVGAINSGQVLPPDAAYWTAETRTDTGGNSYTTYYKTYDQELQSIRKMFDPAGDAKDINLFFQAFAYDISNPDTVVYNLRNIELTVTLRTPIQTPMGLFSEFTADDKRSIEPTQLTLVKGSDGLWKITKWIDTTIGNYDVY